MKTIFSFIGRLFSPFYIVEKRILQVIRFVRNGYYSKRFYSIRKYSSIG